MMRGQQHNRVGISLPDRRARIEPPTAGSWWASAPRTGFTDLAHTHAHRMHLSRVGVPLVSLADASLKLRKRRAEEVDAA